MSIILFGIYIFFLAFIWSFFIIAKIHAYKFKSFSERIEKITNILFFILLTLSIVGFILIFTVDTTQVKKVTSDEVKSNIHY